MKVREFISLQLVDSSETTHTCYLGCRGLLDVAPPDVRVVFACSFKHSEEEKTCMRSPSLPTPFGSLHSTFPPSRLECAQK